jgi:subtilisin-like proprotein convertase family protein
MKLKITFILLTGFLLSSTSSAQDKASRQAELNQLGVQAMTAKAAGDAATLSTILASYTALAASLGNDDPAGLLANASSETASGQTRAAPSAPPGTVSTTANVVGGGAGTAITDNNSFDVTASVGGTGAYLWDLDLNLDITHTFPGDLDITLTSPAGSTVVVSTDNGGGSDDVFAGTLFDDQAGAGNEVTDFVYSTGVTATPLIVEGTLDRFRGEDPNGTWTLTVGDDAGGDTGALNAWSLDVTTLDAAPTDGMTTTAMNSPALGIVDNASVSDTVLVSGADGFTCGVELFTDITHTFNSDLEITLVAPSGTIATITTDNGGGNDDVFAGTLWTSLSNNAVTDFVYTNGVAVADLQPEGSLAAFLGEDPNGAWVLNIADDAGGDQGTLNNWSVSVTGCVDAGPGLPQPPQVPTLSTWGMLLMALALMVIGSLIVRRRAS